MPVPIGTKLGTYEVTSHIGSGGMGEVYQAHDSKLGRDVAIKVLPEQFARDPERLARFQREAKMLAALNHPNIAAIYGLEQSGSTHYLVMELVPGQTLAERILAGAILVDEALPIARQVADAVEYAHDKNVIHRDLKPANIKVTAEGTVKVLDFGLAKALSDEVAAVDMSNSPTLSMAATRQGVILGTAAYMSPEQAKGKVVDRRADVWAFGALLFEMLTGKAAFQGDDVTEVMAAVVRAEPDWNKLPSGTPASVRGLLRRCLDKNLRRRLRDVGEARIILEDVLSGAVGIDPVATQIVPALGRQALFGLVALLLGALITGFALWSLRPVPAPQPVSRLVIPLPASESLSGTARSMLAFSPDGTQLAYIAGTQQRIYLRALDSLEARPVTGTEGALSPFFSPDGQWIGFFANNKLKKVAVTGGAVLTLCESGNPFGGTWGENDTIVFAATGTAGLAQVSSAGGAAQSLTRLKEGELAHHWPQFLPDGRTYLYTSEVGAKSEDSNIVIQRLNSPEQKVLIRGGTYPQYVPTGHLVYYHAGTIMAVPFDLSRLEVRGTPSPVLEGVMASSVDSGAAQFSFSRLGSLAYVPGASQDVRDQGTLVWVDRKGMAQPLSAPPRSYTTPRLSPDGRQVALGLFEAGKGDIWNYDLTRGTLTRLTFEGRSAYPVWTPDGKRIAYRSQGGGSFDIFWKPADGSGVAERLTTGKGLQTPTSFSPDGRTLGYMEIARDTAYDIWVVPVEGDRKPQLFLQTPAGERGPWLSPDGRWSAYASDESGRYEIYVRPFPGTGGKWQISNEGGAEVAWSSKGNELFYRTGDQREKMMVVDISTQTSFSSGKPRLLFEGPYASTLAAGSWSPDYSVALDGQHFLMVKPMQEQQSAVVTQINVVQNWFEELKLRAPSGTK